MANNADEEVAKLRRDFEELRTDVSSLLDSMKDAGAQRGRDSWERARRAGESLHEEVETCSGRRKARSAIIP